jgi:hypothetical protein
MFAITTKVKVAAGIAAGVLTLGAAGAYAANAASANNTITVASPSPTALPNGGPTLVSVHNTTLGTLPKFTNSGDCISYFAQNRDWALATSGTPTTSGGLKFSKNYHGKLMSGLHQWCQTFNSNATTSQSADPSTDSADSADSTDTGSLPAAASHGHGHGHGHGLAD